MKFLQVILSLSFLVLVPLLVVESSSLNDTSAGNITIGSSISPSFNGSSSYWLSPSGNIAFGFYKLACTGSSPYCPDRYVVGIWFVKSPFKILVWTANRDDLRTESAILFTNEGKLVLRKTPDNKELPLIPDIQEPISYAMMHDNGNLVLYGSHSQIVYESYNHPTDTILGGQMLRPGVDLISGGNRLSVQQTNGLLAIYNRSECVSVISHAHKGSLSVTLNLDTSGKLYLVRSDGIILNYLYKNKNRQARKQGERSIIVEDVHMYRATLDSEAKFNLYKERIDGNINDDEESSILLRSWPIYHMMSTGDIWLLACLCFFCLGLPVLLICRCVNFDI